MGCTSDRVNAAGRQGPFQSKGMRVLDIGLRNLKPNATAAQTVDSPEAAIWPGPVSAPGAFRRSG